MRNIYIETDENFRVTKIHRMPFDPNNGMGYTREELEKKGFFVEEVPEPIHQVGRRNIAMYNPDTKSIYYECVNVAISDKERADQLENALNWIMMNSIYGNYGHPTVMTMDASVTSLEPKLNVFEEGAANYLASQIISNKLDAKFVMGSYPQFADYIKNKLSDNGIQV